MAGEIDALAQRDSALAREAEALTASPAPQAPPPADVDALIAACREAASLATNATFAQRARLVDTLNVTAVVEWGETRGDTLVRIHGHLPPADVPLWSDALPASRRLLCCCHFEAVLRISA